MNTVRIGAGAGYAGDRIEPALDLVEHGTLDYLVFECLAERTIALAQRARMRDPDAGYDALLVPRMQRLLPLLARHPVKVISNMGAANPLAAVARIRELASTSGLAVPRIAAITGDDVFDRIAEYAEATVLETGEPLRKLKGTLISANAYLGARPIAAALAAGAEMIITGRVADPSLFVAPLMHEFGHAWSDFTFLGRATVTGHLLECAGQLTGGYFADPGCKAVPDPWNIGFPIATVAADGAAQFGKLAGTGGLLTAATVKEQLLYEIHDPSRYLTPDVVADFSSVEIIDHGGDRVEVSGGDGSPKSGRLKVSIGYLDGFAGHGEISYAGTGAVDRARLAAEIITHRLRTIGLLPRAMRCDVIGVNSLFADSKSWSDNYAATQCRDVRLRIAAHVDTREQAELIGREVEALYTNGPAGGGGVTAGVSERVSIASILIPESDVNPQVIGEGEHHATT
ncbi:MAG: DUF1446 domain-containing protein [Gammaproteobacteria bacterium]|nr:DUF1446 domain-containing protein [Gammaproteobacteria bacterium]